MTIRAFAGLPFAKSIDDRPTWSIVCFFVDRSIRGRGLAEHLLEAGLDYARAKGAECIEAYPIDKPVRVENETAFVGTKSMFDRAGFREVARRRPIRPLMCKELSG